MPTTWYVPRGGGAVATDASEPDGVSVAARLGELCEAVSTGGEIVVIASTGGVSVAARLGELCCYAEKPYELIEQPDYVVYRPD
jgi:hypothetical protein